MKDYNKIKNKFYFSTGTKKEVNMCVKECGFQFRITKKMCDCDTAIGRQKPDMAELKEFEYFIKELCAVRGIKHIYLCKNWIGETNHKNIEVHINDIDIKDYLANLENNCLYKFHLYKRYY